jgi:hypothetical protein
VLPHGASCPLVVHRLLPHVLVASQEWRIKNEIARPSFPEKITVMPQKRFSSHLHAGGDGELVAVAVLPILQACHDVRLGGLRGWVVPV